MLIRQIRSLGSQSKGYGVHAEHIKVRKPEVSFTTPTYLIGGSDYSLTRQGGFILWVLGSFISALQKIACFFDARIARNINREIEESGTTISYNEKAVSGIRRNRKIPGDSFNLDTVISFHFLSIP